MESKVRDRDLILNENGQLVDMNAMLNRLNNSTVRTVKGKSNVAMHIFFNHNGCAIFIINRIGHALKKRVILWIYAMTIQMLKSWETYNTQLVGF